MQPLERCLGISGGLGGSSGLGVGWSWGQGPELHRCPGSWAGTWPGLRVSSNSSPSSLPTCFLLPITSDFRVPVGQSSLKT